MEDSAGRLSRLSEATLRISESLGSDDVLQEVLEGARALTGALCGAIIVAGDAGRPREFRTSGLSQGELLGLMTAPEGPGFFEYVTGLSDPLRVPDFAVHCASMGLPELTSPPVGAFVAAPIWQGGQTVGCMFLARRKDDGGFSQEDEETLVMFAALAALVISNDRPFRDEHRARVDPEALVEISPVGVLLFDARTGQILMANSEARRMTGVQGHAKPLEEMQRILGQMSIRFANNREISFTHASVPEVLENREKLRAEEIVVDMPDGRSLRTVVDGAPVFSDEGELMSVLVTVQDMTPMEELEKLRAEFLGMVSHELRAPLTSIKGSTDAMLESYNSLDPAEAVQFLRIIKSQTERMRDLIGELLDVARIETGTLSATPEPADVASLVDEARNTFLSGGGTHSISIDLEPDLPWVMADRRRIAQVLGNLLTNAARYSEQASTILVNAVLDGSYVAVAVTDNGRGIAKEELPFLFIKFSRIEDDGERRVTDTGLGLAICKGIVEAHGGRIWAESEGVGMGTRFTFTLPVADEMRSAIPMETSRPSGRSRVASTGQARILAVDDDPMTLRYVRNALSGAGFVPLVTADPDEALRIVESERPQLALLDLMLPGRDGIDLMGGILDVADIPVIFLSAYGRDEVVARAIEAGAVDYMVKPFSPTELAARVRGALRWRLGTSPDEESGPFVLGELTIDYAGRRVSVAGNQVQMTPTEYELLFELSVNAGRVVTFDTLLDRVWGMNRARDRGSVRTYVKRLRRKLGDSADDPKYIFAEPRVGYRMQRPKAPTEAER